MKKITLFRLPISMLAALLGVSLLGALPTWAWALDDGRLALALEMDDVNTIRKAIEAGEATPNSFVIGAGYPFAPGAPMLIIAARQGSEKVARYLIDSGADLNSRTNVDETPLMLAAFFPDVTDEPMIYDRHERIVHMLVEAGAELENLPHWYTAVSYSAYYNHIRITRYLLDHGAKVDGVVRNGVSSVPTALMFAAEGGYKSLVRLLLERGADPHVITSRGLDAIYFAKKGRQSAIVPLLQCARSLHPGELFQDKCGALP